MTDRKPLHLLQYGRGLAALAVAAFHLSILLGEPRYLGDAVFHAVTWRGNLGVDFFFVLSGFIIFYAHDRDIGRPERLRPYLRKRFTRLYPVYWVYALGMCALLALGLGSATAFPHGVTDWISTLLLVRFDGFELPITPAWSLMHELSFYALFGVLILSQRIGWAVLVAWLSTAVLFGVYAEEGSRTALNTYFSAFNMDFAVGIAAYFAWKLRAPRIALPCIGLGLGTVALCYLAEANGHTLHFHPLGYALGFGLIIAGAAALETHRQFRPIAALKFLGDASYSIYLTHLALLGLACKIAIAATRFVALPHWAIYGIALAAAVLGGCAAHLLVEKPLLRRLRGREQSSAQGSRGRFTQSTDAGVSLKVQADLPRP
ncbi:peptidoglycan/LPS O-acetylase OafA/YrhL [Rhodopseudomonas rhenobacensis]|uniref:Peptidoglycan/LPS O-acetylase OafA/YrhL n=1 Tax=Rhodopseudomonas rhenobacensis TaxID=87461 RepID=A0A7W7Z1P4_9BRAD|nr:acyltransferase [Rhodopseudomonas rhenobacensis]MBB5046170.1 peptidoglycan/LPS O-acetylase OafA/YrhL [Rhodopseudomonas rhenobacensis]